jgi:protein TonB
MELKKNYKVDLRYKKNLFFEIGMVTALTVVLMAFQYKSKEIHTVVLNAEIFEGIPEQFMPITRMEQPKPPELPKHDPIKEIKLVKNSDETPDALPDFTSEDIYNTPIPVMPMPEEAPLVEQEYVYFAEKMPEFVGGMPALIKYLKKELHYPDEARINNVQGKVFIEFVVNKYGGIEKATVKKGVDPLLDQEALRVVNIMPKWNPGAQNLKPVSVCFTIPINFKLSN